jgi:acyl carrier protein
MEPTQASSAMTTIDRIVAVIGRVFENRGEESPLITENSPLYDEGIGLDSLDAATLSAFLEQEFGHDPYTSGRFPQTVSDLIAYYETKDVVTETAEVLAK